MTPAYLSALGRQECLPRRANNLSLLVWQTTSSSATLPRRLDQQGNAERLGHVGFPNLGMDE